MRENNSKSLLPAYIGVIFTLLFFPWSIVNNPFWALGVIVPYVVWMQYTRKLGSGFVIISMTLCIPEISGAVELQSYMSNQTVWVYRSVYFLILSNFLVTYKDQYIFDYASFNFKPVILYSLFVLFATIFTGKEDFILWLYRILTIPLFFYSCINSQITFNQIFRCFSLMMIIVGVYALVDYFVGINPYRFIIEMTHHYNANAFYRASGILGNSLILVGVYMSFFTMILIRWNIEGKINLILLLFSIVTLLISGSRTCVISIMVITIFYVVYVQNKDELLKYILVLLVSFLVVISVIDYIYPDYYNMMFNRFSQHSDHRESGYMTTYNIFQNNIWGVGSKGLSRAMSQNATSGLILGFETLDNSFLTLIACLGVFSPFAFLFYFHYMIEALKNVSYSVMYKNIVIWFLPWVLIGFSYTAISYLNITLLYFGVSGYLYHSVNNQFTNNRFE